MTCAELIKMNDREVEALFDGMFEPSFRKTINTEIDPLDKIIEDFEQCNISEKDREALANDLVSLS